MQNDPDKLKPTVQWAKSIEAVLAGEVLPQPIAKQLFAEALVGVVSDIQVAGLLIALRSRGYNANEIAGFSQAMTDASIKIDTPPNSIDIVGTGGSAHGKKAALNVSTMASFVVAAGNVPVLKHGNRKISSTSGSFDFLDVLGVPILESASEVTQSVNKFGLGFAYAKAFHPAMRHVATVRTELGVPTVFNLIGPLCNPGNVNRIVMGASQVETAKLLADVLALDESCSALVVHGLDGIDEISLSANTKVFTVADGLVSESEIGPSDFGLEQAESPPFGGSPEDNLEIFTSICKGTPSPHRDLVLINAAAGFVVGGVAASLSEGFANAVKVIETGALAELVESMSAAN